MNVLPNYEQARRVLGKVRVTPDFNLEIVTEVPGIYDLTHPAVNLAMSKHGLPAGIVHTGIAPIFEMRRNPLSDTVQSMRMGTKITLTFGAPCLQ